MLTAVISFASNYFQHRASCSQMCGACAMITAADLSSLNLSSPALDLWKLFAPPLLRINKSAVTLLVLFEMFCSCMEQGKTDLYASSPCYLCCYRSPLYPASTISFLIYSCTLLKEKPFHISSLLLPFSELQSCGLLSEIVGSELHTTGKYQQTSDLCSSSKPQSLFLHHFPITS